MDETYLSNLDKYYEIKSTYETKKKRILQSKKLLEASKKERRQIYDELVSKLPCVSCGRKVGTIFQEKDRFLTAICGDTSSPCKLNIRLQKPNSLNAKYEVSNAIKDLNDIEYSMIQLKLNHLFGFIDENALVEIYETYKQEYEDLNSTLQLLNSHIEMTENIDAKRSKIRSAKQTLFDNIKDLKMYIREYLATENTSLITDAIDTYMDTILPAQQEIRDTNYNAFYLDNEPVKIKKDILMKHILVKKPYTIDMDTVVIEDPNTLEFVGV